MLLPSGENLSATVEAHDLPVDERSAEVAPRRPFRFARARLGAVFSNASVRPGRNPCGGRRACGEINRDVKPSPGVVLQMGRSSCWSFGALAQARKRLFLARGRPNSHRRGLDRASQAFLRHDGGCDRTSPKRRGSAVHQPDICALAIEVGLFDAQSGLGRRNQRRAFTLTFTKS